MYMYLCVVHSQVIESLKFVLSEHTPTDTEYWHHQVW